MKTIKFMLFAAIMFVFSNGLTYGQASNKNKETIVETEEWSGYIPCTDEFASGTDKYTLTWWDGKGQLRAKGHYIGENGNDYEWSWIESINFKDWVEGQAYTQTYILRTTITCNGEVIAEAKVTAHVTVNANGEVTSEFEKGGLYWECLE